jgi:hypothetical protein
LRNLQDAARQEHATEKMPAKVEKRKIISFPNGPKPLLSWQNAQNGPDRGLDPSTDDFHAKPKELTTDGRG